MLTLLVAGVAVGSSFRLGLLFVYFDERPTRWSLADGGFRRYQHYVGMALPYTVIGWPWAHARELNAPLGRNRPSIWGDVERVKGSCRRQVTTRPR